jgi:hypothetical protein
MVWKMKYKKIDDGIMRFNGIILSDIYNNILNHHIIYNENLVVVVRNDIIIRSFRPGFFQEYLERLLR